VNINYVNFKVLYFLSFSQLDITSLMV